MKVYTISGAPKGWRVLVGLTLKRIEHDVQYLQGSTKEHKQAEFLKINHRGMVPVIEHKGSFIHDSIAILAWLDREYPQHPLFGETSSEAEHIWQITMENCDYLRDAINMLLGPILVNNIELPTNGSEAMKQLDKASKMTHDELSYLESVLGSSLFLAGQRPSAAEAICFPEVRLIKRAIEKKPSIMQAAGFGDFDDRYPTLAAWANRVESLPGMSKTLPYHW